MFSFFKKDLSKDRKVEKKTSKNRSLNAIVQRIVDDKVSEDPMRRPNYAAYSKKSRLSSPIITNNSAQSAKDSNRFSRRFIREVVVGRSNDDYFDIHVSQGTDGELIATGSGFFPGDRLITLNGRNLGSMDASKMNRIIRSLAGRTLIVQVLSLTTHEDCSKSIKRFGTIRHPVSQENQSNDSAGGENLYWLVSGDLTSYVPVSLIKKHSSKAIVKYANGGKLVEVDLDCLEKANHAEFDMSDDLSTLTYVNESSLLHVLKTRFSNGYYYTFLGPILTVMGFPNVTDKNLLDIFKDFNESRQESLPPHIFSLSSFAYSQLLKTGSNQTILLIGSQHSSKTEQTQLALKYICLRSKCNSDTMSTLQAVDAICTLVNTCVRSSGKSDNEATTIYKVNFDCFGKFHSIDVEIMLLERSKLFYHHSGSFLMLFAVACCTNQTIRHQFMLDELNLETNLFLCKADFNEDLCISAWTEVFNALQTLKFDEHSIYFICCLCSVILHVGSCEANRISGASVNTARSICASFLPINRAAQILNISLDEFLSFMFQSSKNSNDSQKKDDLTPLKCLCGFATALYDFMIEFILTSINKYFHPNTTSTRSIVVMDISGTFPFTNLNTATGTFPEMMNNYFNEKLQSILHSVKFYDPLSELKKEIPDINITKTTTRPLNSMLKLMEKLPVSKPTDGNDYGLMWLLDHDYLSHEDVIDAVVSEAWKSGEQLISLVERPAVFCLHHFGGALPVIYDPTEWFAVYRDLPSCNGISILFKNSKRDFIKDSLRVLKNKTHSFLMGSDAFPLKNNRRRSGAFTFKKATAARLCNEMNYVFDLIRSSNALVCYCLVIGVKKNEKNLAEKINQALLRTQMRAFDFVAVTRLYKTGLLNRMSHEQFLHDYSPLSTGSTGSLKGYTTEAAVKNFINKLSVDPATYAVGPLYIFMRNSLLAELNFKKDEKTEIFLIQLQAICRSYLSKLKLRRKQIQNTAIQCIQRNGRAYMRMCQWLWWKLFNMVKAVAPVYSYEQHIHTLETKLAELNKRLEKASVEREHLVYENGELESMLDLLKIDRENERLSREEIENALELERKKREDVEHQFASTKKLLAEKSDLVRKYELWAVESKNGISVGESVGKYDNVSYILCDNSRIHELENKISELSGMNEDLVKKLEDAQKRCMKAYEELQDNQNKAESRCHRMQQLEVAEEKFNSEISRLQTLVAEETHAKNQSIKERDEALHDKSLLERTLQEKESELTEWNAKFDALLNENLFLKDVKSTDVDIKEVIALRTAVKSMEAKIADLEIELDERAIAIQQKEQARQRIEMELQQERKKFTKEFESREEELDNVRANFLRRAKMQEQKLDEEIANCSNLRKQLRAMEMKLSESSSCDNNVELAALKRKLVHYRALLDDARLQLREKSTVKLDEIEGSLIVKNLRSKLEDLEIENSSLTRSKNSLKSELDEVTKDLDEAWASKSKLEDQINSLQREKSDLLQRLDDQEEESAEMLKKIQGQLNATACDQNQVSFLSSQLGILTEENTGLKAKCLALEMKIQEMENTKKCDVVTPLECKIRELENKLNFEIILKNRLQSQVDRLKEQLERHNATESGLIIRTKSLEDQIKQTNIKHRECINEIEILQRKCSEYEHSRNLLTDELKKNENECQELRSQLRVSSHRIELLQQALNEDSLDTTAVLEFADEEQSAEI